MSVPALLGVAEDERRVQVCATLSLSINSDVDIAVTINTRDGTGIISRSSLDRG